MRKIALAFITGIVSGSVATIAFNSRPPTDMSFQRSGLVDDFDQDLEAMRGSGWWQLSQSSSTTGGNVSGEYRFVTFIPRDSEDTLVLQYASSVCD